VAEEEAVAAEEQEEKPKPAKAGSSIGKMLMIVVLALVSSAGGGVVSFVLMSRVMGVQAAAGHEAEAGEEKKSEEENLAELLEKSAVLPLEPFVVNLADTETARYLRIKISLMIDDKEKLPEIIENQALQLKVRDVILSSLTNKTSQELINQDGKNKLRHEIQEKAAIYFREPKLVDVMFTEFVIQL
jgi:flagellar protein FliL